MVPNIIKFYMANNVEDFSPRKMPLLNDGYKKIYGIYMFNLLAKNVK